MEMTEKLKEYDRIIMGIDPGTRVMGYGVLGIRGRKPEVIVQGVIKLDRFESHYLRLHRIYERVESLAAQYLPDEVAPMRSTAICFGQEHGKLWPAFDFEKYLTILKEFEVDPDQLMDSMSAGQLKKSWISFALACNARHYFMDEPTNGLDIPSKSQFRKAITKYTSEESAVVISTHQVRDLEEIIDPIIILDKEAVLLNASLKTISDKLYFDYGTALRPGSLYLEHTPSGAIQVYPNTSGEESKVNLEALFNAVHSHKDVIKALFQQPYEK